ncbi:hypothetical protein CFC21_081389 [Triticum aestivum]|uniref:F-box domain-containing protein n=2 Tax=Triticum aestivum TaxID=4565 RepID=A0A9R1L400_WHEAT|nr:putative F-box/kelch-repeat protein At3g17540 [Triticum aestivum]KAF7076780.1 hypothetical protein CFC21_081389 [Triticum aestivum]
MDAAAEVPQGQEADPIPSSPHVDVSSLRRSVLLAGPVSEVLRDDNLLIEILVRLPPKPSSLPRASAVCKRWGSILSDPHFRKRFRKHHQKPPLLGFFRGYAKNFIPAMDSPDRIPAARFSLPKSRIPYQEDETYMGCRHGLSLLISMHKGETVVWDPLTGEERIMAFPPGFNSASMGSYCGWHGTVLCVDAEDGHVHGDCFSSPFKLVLVCAEYNTPAFCSVYDSASGVWGDIFSTMTITAGVSRLRRPSTLVGNALCLLISGGDVLVFDFKMQSLCLLEKPVENHGTDDWYFQLLRMENDGLGLAILLDLTIKLWERKSNSYGVFEWVLLQKTIPLEGTVPRRMDSALFVGYDEDANVIVLTTITGNFTLQVDSMQIKHIVKRNNICLDTFYPYRNFYTAGIKS